MNHSSQHPHDRCVNKIFSSADTTPWHLFACALIAFSTLVRIYFVYSGQLNLAQDEAQYWDWSRHWQLSYYSKGPLIAWIIAFWTEIFGANEWGVRFGALLNGLLAQLAIYGGLAVLMRRPRLAVLSLVIINTSPLFMAAAILMTTDNPLLLCWIVALFSLYATARWPEKSTAFYCLGLSMAIGTLAKYMMLAMFGIAGLFWLILYRHALLEKVAALKSTLVMLAGTLCGMLPILIWNAQNQWVGFRHVATLAGVTSKKQAALVQLKYVPEFLGGQIGIASPWWMLFILLGALVAARLCFAPRAESSLPFARRLVTHEPLMQNALFFSAFVPLWAFMFLWSFHTRIYANWPGMSYIGGMMLGALYLDHLLTTHRAFWGKLCMGLGAALFLLVYGQQFLPLPAHLNPSMRLKGWADMGAFVGSLRQTLDTDVFFLSDEYDVTAELAFYLPNQPVSYSADFGRRKNQYDFWPGPQDKIGWDAILVRKKGDEIHPALLKMFDSAELMHYRSTHKNAEGRTFTVILLKNYNGSWPESSAVRY